MKSTSSSKQRKRAFIRMGEETKSVKLKGSNKKKCEGRKVQVETKSNESLADVNSKNCTGANNWEKFIGKKSDHLKASNSNVVKNPNQNQKKANNTMKLTKIIGMDCEMVGIGKDGKDSILARVSLVNAFGDRLYDKFVKPRETVTDYRTFVSGVREGDLADAEEFEVVQKEVAELIKGRTLVGHGLKNDMEVLFLSHPRRYIRDTSIFFKKKAKGTPSLKSLALEYLGVKIQEGEHSSVQDAKAAVQLYNMFRKQWETTGGSKARIDSPSNSMTHTQRISTENDTHKEKYIIM